jgi:acetyl-CoA carboxylase biotin carboxyl carrier protein
MELTSETVESILEVFERADLEYLSLETGDTKLVLQKGGSPTAVATAQAVPAPQRETSPAGAQGAAAPVPEPVPAAAPVAEVRTDGPAEESSAGLTTITAPVVGVFYSCPEPGASPYVEVGSRVEVGETVGLVEVMKMFNSISSTVAGEVVEILVKNEEFVEFGQPIFVVRSETAA